MAEVFGVVQALRKFFATAEKPLTTPELAALSKDERRELAELAAAELGVVLEPAK